VNLIILDSNCGYTISVLQGIAEMKIGFIGLGVMGAPMAVNLIGSGKHEVCVFDIEPDRTDRIVELGAQRGASVNEVVRTAEIVMTSLPGPKQIEAVAFGDGGLFASIRPGAIWIDLSTNNLALCKRIEKMAGEKKIDFMDCPVSGGDEGARDGSLFVMAGGNGAVFDLCLPLFNIIGERVVHLGSTGAGYSAKIAQVTLCYLHSLALSEALMLGVKGGVAPSQMLSIIQNSTGRSYVADRYGPSILNGDYDHSFTVGLAHKDMKLAREMADELGICLPMCDLTTGTYSDAIDAYGYDANHLKVVQLLEEKNETFLRG
jgi:3-hydroxyisobutyrate dehydrogenase